MLSGIGYKNDGIELLVFHCISDKGYFGIFHYNNLYFHISLFFEISLQVSEILICNCRSYFLIY
jgi:hypothetical protein